MQYDIRVKSMGRASQRVGPYPVGAALPGVGAHTHPWGSHTLLGVGPTYTHPWGATPILRGPHHTHPQGLTTLILK